RRGLIARPKRGVVAITDAGRAVLAAPPSKLDAAFLRNYPAFMEFLRRKRSPSEGTDAADSVSSSADTDVAPEELIGAAERANRAEVESDILATVRALDPAAFERLVIRLLVAMG